MVLNDGEEPDGCPGVLLINLGTPDGPDYWSVRRYLREFLSDRRVIEVNPLLWQPLLNLVVLSSRPRATARAYRKIWDDDRNGSPLRRYTGELADGLRSRFAGAGLTLDVDWAMRYGSPSVPEKLQAFQDRGCRRILLLALYPQYSATTTATAYDKAFDALRRMRWQPSIRTAPPYCGEPAYIAALAASVRAHVAERGGEPERLLASFHGLPKRYVDAGDPYYGQCVRTTQLLADALGWPGDRVALTFQSRFGREEWLRPYTLDALRALPAEGVTRVAVIAPGFAADCLETLEEVAIGLREDFLAAGGTEFAYIPCLNGTEAGVDVMETLVRRELSGWLQDGAVPASAAPAVRSPASPASPEPPFRKPGP